MKYEVLEDGGDWLVLHDDREVARFDDQDAALGYIAERLRGESGSGGCSLVVRYQARG